MSAFLRLFVPVRAYLWLPVSVPACFHFPIHIIALVTSDLARSFSFASSRRSTVTVLILVLVVFSYYSLTKLILDHEFQGIVLHKSVSSSHWQVMLWLPYFAHLPRHLPTLLIMWSGSRHSGNPKQTMVCTKFPASFVMESVLRASSISLIFTGVYTLFQNSAQSYLANGRAVPFWSFVLPSL